LKAIGLRREDILDRTPGEWLPDELGATLAAHYQMALQGHPGRMEGALNDRYFEIRVFPLRYEVGDVGAGMFVLQDITGQKRAEMEILRAKEAAEAADRAKSEFMANISHELRTPMHAVLNFAWLGITRRKTLTIEQVTAYFREIHENGGKLMVFINDLIDLSSLAADRFQLGETRCDLAEEAETALVEVAEEARAKNIEIQIHPDPSIPEAAADATRIQQVIRHLLANAVAFSPRNANVQVHFASASPQGDGEEKDGVEIRITDQGPGVPEAERETIFEKFTRSSRTRSGAGGAGLGLALCRAIVKLHGGRIWVEDAPNGAGSTFRCRLPPARTPSGEPVAVRRRVRSVPSGPASPPILGPMTPPPPETLEALYHLALIGDIFTLQEQVDQLESQNSHYRPFAERLREMSHGFQLEEIQIFLMRFLEDHHGTDAG
jgi:signal transduction histidine kinase